MTHVLGFIGRDNNMYVNSSDGNPSTYADTLSVNVDDTLETTILGKRNLAEQSSFYKLYQTRTHNYYKVDNNNQIVQDSVSAVDMPDYLIGWRTSDGYRIQINETLNQQFIDNYFEENNLNLYAIWEETHLIRVIVFVPTNTQQLNVKYNVGFATDFSYDNNEDYVLSESFMDIEDTGEHLAFSDGSYIITEFGSGYGCANNGTIHYFGVKDGDSVSLMINEASGYKSDYIPYYEYDSVNQTVVYKCGIAGHLVRISKSPIQEFGFKRLAFDSSNGNVWTIDNLASSTAGVNSDITVFVQLARKPMVLATITPLNGGTITGDGAYMPGDRCTLSAFPFSGYKFVKWMSGGIEIRNSSHSFVVTENSNWEVFFEQTSDLFTFSWFTTEDGIDLTGSVMLDINSTSEIVTGTPTYYFVDNNSVAVATINKSGTGNTSFRGVYSYEGNVINPSVDRKLSGNGFLGSGVEYSLFEMSTTLTMRLDFSSMIAGVATQLYVLYA